MIEKKRFVAYTTAEERQKMTSYVYSIRINKKMLKEIQTAQRILRQPKMTTCIKTLVSLGLISVVQDTKTQAILTEAIDNTRRNDRIGIVDPNAEIKQL
jgi:hypothetical protein